MGDQMETLPSEPQLDVDALRSRIRKITDIRASCDDVLQLSASDSEKLLQDSALHFQSKFDEILSEFSDVSSLSVPDLDAYLEQLKGDVSSIEEENSKMSDEIKDLTRTFAEDYSRLESDREGLNYSLDFITLQGPEKAKLGGHLDYYTHEEGQMIFSRANGDCKFKMSELSDQIERNNKVLKLLQDLDCNFKRFEAVEKIEDALTGLKVIEFEGTCIRFSLTTYVPNVEHLLSQHKIEDKIDSMEQNHNLVVEVEEGTMNIKNVQIFPNDVYIGEIIDAAKSLRHHMSPRYLDASLTAVKKLQLFSTLPLLETRSSLEWLVRRVQERIVLCILRRFLVKSANKSRHFFEYLDRDEIIIAHMVGGVDAFIKLSQSWPISSSALKLISLRSSIQSSKEISLSFLCKVEEAANSMDAHFRQSISTFVDAIEETLVQNMREELQSDTRGKM